MFVRHLRRDLGLQFHPGGVDRQDAGVLLVYKHDAEAVGACQEEVVAAIAVKVGDVHSLELDRPERHGASRPVDAVLQVEEQERLRVPVEQDDLLGTVAIDVQSGGADDLGRAAAGVRETAFDVVEEQPERLALLPRLFAQFLEVGLGFRDDRCVAVGITEFDQLDRVGLVVGGEGDGLRALVRRTCDFEVRIPMAAGVESLNVSVATGAALFELCRKTGQLR